jgi:DNA (cytosine-5)-methyltransferase 1
MSFTLIDSELSAKVTPRGQRIFISNALISQKCKLSIGDKLKLVLNKATKEIVATKVKEGEKGDISVTPSGKRYVIDLHNKKIYETLGVSVKRVNIFYYFNRIVIRPTTAALKAYQRIIAAKRKILAGKPLDVGETCSGIGALSNAISSGFEKVGQGLRLAFANDHDLEAMEAATRCAMWDEETMALNCSMEQIPTEMLPQIDMLVGGLSCKGASRQARTGVNKSISLPEFHDEAGFLVAPFIHLAMTTNPLIIVVENVPQYLDTASCEIMRQTFKRLGYKCHEEVFNAQDYGSLEARRRMALVFTTVGIDFSFEHMFANTKTSERTVGDLLNHNDPIIPPIPNLVSADITEETMNTTKAERNGWYPKQILLNREAAKKALGKGHRACIIDPEDKKISTISASYGKGVRLDESIVTSPCGQWLRLLTPFEHANFKDIDPYIIANTPKTAAHRLLGNSICTPPWVLLGETIALSLKKWFTPSASQLAA